MFLTYLAAPFPAHVPVARHAFIRYPPVGASQSNISPAQKIPGIDFIIKSLFKAFFEMPPAVEIASLMG